MTTLNSRTHRVPTAKQKVKNTFRFTAIISKDPFGDWRGKIYEKEELIAFVHGNEKQVRERTKKMISAFSPNFAIITK